MMKPAFSPLLLLLVMMIATIGLAVAAPQQPTDSDAGGSVNAAGKPGGKLGRRRPCGRPELGRPGWPCWPPRPCTPYVPSNTTCDAGTHLCVVRMCRNSYDYCAADDSVETCGTRCQPCDEPNDKFQIAACRTLRDADGDNTRPVQACGVQCMPGFAWDDSRQTCVRPLPSECAGLVPDGFWLEVNLDSPFSDLERVGGLSEQYAKNWPALAAACNKLPECAAVNSDGWMKFKVEPRNTWDWNTAAWADNTMVNPCGGILVKKAGAAPRPKPTIPAGTPVEKLAQCKKIIPEGYRFVPRAESAYNNIRQVQLTSYTSSTWAQLTAECDAEPTCVAANTLGWLKRSLQPVDSFPSLPARYPCHGLLVKTKCGAAVPEGYVFMPNKDSNGNDIKRVTELYWDSRDWPAITAACSADSKCKAVNSDGWLKHTIRDQTEWNSGFGFPNPCVGMFIKSEFWSEPANATAAAAAADPAAAAMSDDDAFLKKLVDVRAAIVEANRAASAANATRDARH